MKIANPPRIGGQGPKLQSSAISAQAAHCDDARVLGCRAKHESLRAQGNLRAEMLAENFVKPLQKVGHVAARHRPLFIATIGRDGSVKVPAV
jgi:hypothetical protein